MKEPLRLPFVLFLTILCLTIVLAALELASSWGRAAVPGQLFTLAWVVAHLPQAVFAVMAPAVVLAIVLVGVRLLRRRFSRLLAFLIVLVVGYAALVNGLLWTNRPASRSRPDDPPPIAVLRPLAFARIGSSWVAPRTVDGSRLTAVLLADPARPAPRLSVATSATASIKGGEITLRLAGRPAELRAPLEPIASRLFASDALTGLFLADLRAFTADLEALLGRSRLEFFAACFALVFLVAASLVLLRVSRWPLANFFLLGLAVRLYFRLYHLLAVDWAPAIGRALVDPLAARFVPPVVFAVLGVLLLLLDILAIPADRWAGGGEA